MSGIFIGSESKSERFAGAFGFQFKCTHRPGRISPVVRLGLPSELAFAAFYADCSRKTRPVTAGHRLSLVFNLCLRPGDKSTPRKAPDYGEQIDLIATSALLTTPHPGMIVDIAALRDSSESSTSTSNTAPCAVTREKGLSLGDRDSIAPQPTVDDPQECWTVGSKHSRMAVQHQSNARQGYP